LGNILWTYSQPKEINMSDLRRIIADKQVTRGQATPEQRQLNALEEISDSLEGIRQDLTALNLLVGDIGKKDSAESKRPPAGGRGAWLTALRAPLA
jgi:hypothetical protein